MDLIKVQSQLELSLAQLSPSLFIYLGQFSAPKPQFFARLFLGEKEGLSEEQDISEKFHYLSKHIFTKIQKTQKNIHKSQSLVVQISNGDLPQSSVTTGNDKIDSLSGNL